ncbi:GNAT family N-acetyltransferase [Bacillus sp. AK031]
MKLELCVASLSEKDVIKNLMQFYFYDFSEFNRADVTENGQFGSYPYLDHYWEEEGRFPFTLKVGNQYVGFVLVREVLNEGEAFHSIAEFFIMKKYRRTGLGRLAAIEVFERFKGTWEVSQIEGNEPAIIFWRNVIDQYTIGNWTEKKSDGLYIQVFQS